MALCLQRFWLFQHNRINTILLADRHSLFFFAYTFKFSVSFDSSV